MRHVELATPFTIVAKVRWLRRVPVESLASLLRGKGNKIKMKFDPNVKAFLDRRLYASLATIRSDGSPQQTVMWFVRDGDSIVMNTLKGRAKERQLARDNRASVIVEDGLKYVAMSGTVSIDEDPVRGQAVIAGLAERYDGPEEAAAMVESSFSKQHRVTLVFTPERIDVHGLDD